ncbi:hypothetical protein KGF56_002629 [Candida oxycetoniae]|uniref:CREG-like beta-barrel domain-containing protein n=1 Tax=Candida oxycetoniae TaxID=497107 RepID=A0AAI9SWW0_9ASCO|nr:uncharacterized protein KGF56_002629 [Candida oxycetoniae]KAI3404584.2 hypothetical protein KGF56_002629 [Candida oxycetoniae]
MLLYKLVFIACCYVGALTIPRNDQIVVIENSPVSREEGASVARTLVHRESLVNVNTIKTIRTQTKEGPGPKNVQVPVSSMEYYADCDGDGDPYWLVIDVGGPNQNIVKGSPFSFTIRDGDHPDWDEVSEEYPGKRKGSNAGSPRVQLFGKLEYINFLNPFDPKRVLLEKCFLERHPDAAMWLPGNVVSPHKSHWVKIKVESVYMIGGFGDIAYLGELTGDEYHSAKIIDPQDGDDENVNENENEKKLVF